MNKHKEVQKTTQQFIDIYPEYLELKAKATPKKPNIKVIHGMKQVDCCVCEYGYVQGYDDKVSFEENYCSQCGQRWK